MIPQIDKSFLDQISELIAQNHDVDYRQRLIDNLNLTAIGHLLPAEAESLTRDTPQFDAIWNGRPRQPVREPRRPSRMNTVRRCVRFTRLRPGSGIYQTMSRNLDPGLAAYTLTEPVQQEGRDLFQWQS